MDFHCINSKCKKLLFRGKIDQGTISIKCPRCGSVLTVSLTAQKIGVIRQRKISLDK